MHLNGWIGLEKEAREKTRLHLAGDNLSPRIKNALSSAVSRWPAQRRFKTTTGKTLPGMSEE
jgi:hypothetical protein